MRWPFRRRERSGPALPPSTPGRDWALAPAIDPTVELVPPTLTPVLRLPDVSGTRPLPDRPEFDLAPVLPRGRVVGLARSRTRLTHPAPAFAAEVVDVVPEVVVPEVAVEEEPAPRRTARVVTPTAVARPVLVNAVDDYVGEAREPVVPHRTTELDRLLHQQAALGGSPELLAMAFAGFSSSVPTAPPRADDPPPAVAPPPAGQTLRRATLGQSRRLGLTARPAPTQAPDDVEPDEPDSVPATTERMPSAISLSPSVVPPTPAPVPVPVPAVAAEAVVAAEPVPAAAPVPVIAAEPVRVELAADEQGGPVSTGRVEPASATGFGSGPVGPAAVPGVERGSIVGAAGVVEGVAEPPRRLGLGAPLVGAPPRARAVVPDAAGVPDDVAAAFHSTLGVDVEGVPVHRGPEVAERARSVAARAFTEHGEVHLPQDAGHLDEPGARALLAHELMHAVQQRELGTDLPPEDSPAGAALEAAAVAAEDWFRGTGPAPTGSGTGGTPTGWGTGTAPAGRQTGTAWPAPSTDPVPTGLGIGPTPTGWGTDLAPAGRSTGPTPTGWGTDPAQVGWSTGPAPASGGTAAAPTSGGVGASPPGPGAGRAPTPLVHPAASPAVGPDPSGFGFVQRSPASGSVVEQAPVGSRPAVPVETRPVEVFDSRPPDPPVVPRPHEPPPQPPAAASPDLTELRESVARLEAAVATVDGRRRQEPPSPRELDDLAHQLYRRLRGNLRRELLVDRERAGRLTDLR